MSTSASKHWTDVRATISAVRSAGSARVVPAGGPCWPDWDLMDVLSDSDQGSASSEEEEVEEESLFKANAVNEEDPEEEEESLFRG